MTELIEIHCTSEEKELLDRSAALHGLETGAWILAKALESVRRNQPPCHPQCIRPDDHRGGCWIQLLDW